MLYMKCFRNGKRVQIITKLLTKLKKEESRKTVEEIQVRMRRCQHIYIYLHIFINFNV
jgi:hypothetical protein